MVRQAIEWLHSVGVLVAKVGYPKYIAQENGTSTLAGGGEVARSKLEMAVLESHIQRKLGRF